MKLSAVMFLLVAVASGQAMGKPWPHPDYVPNERTAERIAEAVLVAQFGQERVEFQLPLRVRSTSKDLWLVEGTIRETIAAGGNFGVWINKHSGCVSVIEHMK
jgi:NTF2 fold immunity protein